MLAVDTSILVRFITHDEPRQTGRAIALMGHNDVWISKTVLLETEWVLRSGYGFETQRVSEALRRLAGMDNVTLEEPLAVAEAMDLFAAGIDFADAMHVASSGKTERFLTFDEKLVRRAKGRTAIDVTRA